VGVLTESAASALGLFSDVRNKIVHGVQKVSDEEVLRAIDAGIPLLRAVVAIPRERHAVLYPNIELFAADACSTRHRGSGVIIETTSPWGAQVRRELFPRWCLIMCRGWWLTWEWNSEQTWPAAWYKDVTTGKVELAWSSASEFVGRPLNEIS
jgi:hypothetical protein